MGARFFAAVQTSSGAHPVECVPGLFPGVKVGGAEVKEGVELYLDYPSGPSWPALPDTASCASICISKSFM